jgi:hypothetical protein
MTNLRQLSRFKQESLKMRLTSKGLGDRLIDVIDLAFAAFVVGIVTAPWWFPYIIDRSGGFQ